MASKKSKAAAKAAEEAVWMYVGPSVRGLIQQYSIYYGTRESVCSRLSAVIEEYPQVRKLIVRDSEVAKAIKMIANGEAPYANAYKQIK